MVISMPTPSGKIALLLISIFALIAVLGWWFKSQITVFARTLLIHRQRQGSQRTTAATATVQSV